MSIIFSRRIAHKGIAGVFRSYTKQTTAKSSPSAASQTQVNGDVPGLSAKCVAVPNAPVGPGAAKNTEYKNPEYYCYHKDSFAEAEIEMAKFRLPAPSNKRKFVPQ